MTTASTEQPALTQGLLRLMAVATGIVVTTIYYNQPLLGMMGQSLHGGASASLVATASQLGYALGIVLLVPLGDYIDRRQLILWQCAGLVAALCMSAMAPGMAALIVAQALVGVFATIAQHIVPFAASLAEPERRGRAIGTVMSGLLAGILLGRVLGGVVGHAFGWRAVFWMGAALVGLVSMALSARLPHGAVVPGLVYRELLGSLWHLVRREGALRRAAITQGLLFAGFSAFWTNLAYLLQGPGFGLGANIAGLFGILALAGVAMAPLAGRLADTQGPHRAVRLGVIGAIVSFALMGLYANLLTLAVGVVLMDAAIQASLVSNQAIIYARAGAARGRFNTVFITTMFLFGAAGSAMSSLAWTAGGWAAVMGFSAALALVALVLQRRSVVAREQT